MKNTILKKIGGMTLAVLMLAVFAQVRVFAQEDTKTEDQNTEQTTEDLSARRDNDRTIVGVWQTTVTVRNCQTGDPVAPPFQGVSTYNKGGTAAEFAANSSPALRSPGHGIWEASNPFQSTVAFTSLRFNADGTFAGRTVVRQTISLARSGNDFTSTGTFEIFVANGMLVGMGCSTATATRFQ